MAFYSKQQAQKLHQMTNSAINWPYFNFIVPEYAGENNDNEKQISC